MLIVNLFDFTHNIISLIVNCNLTFSLLAEQSLGYLIIILVSSANSIKVLLIEQVGMSLINKRKRSGSRIDPWGTPISILVVLDLHLL